MPQSKLKIVLNLRQHCIETDIKQLYERSLAEYFQSPEDRGTIEEKIALLKRALETLDFSALRSRYPELAGNSNARVSLIADSRSTVALWIHNNQIYP